VTIYHVAGFVKNAIAKSCTSLKIMNSFAKPGIYPFDRNVFQESDFIMARATEQPDPNLMPGILQEVEVKEEDDVQDNDDFQDVEIVQVYEMGEEPEEVGGSSDHACEGTGSPDQEEGDSFVSPFKFRGLPKVKPGVKSRKPRRTGKCMIATDTPDKAEIEAREKEQLEKKDLQLKKKALRLEKKNAQLEKNATTGKAESAPKVPSENGKLIMNPKNQVKREQESRKK